MKDHLHYCWNSDTYWYCSGPRHPSFSRSLRKLADEADVEFMNRESSLGSVYWEPAEPGTFLIRGKHFLRDHKKVTFNFFNSSNVKLLPTLQLWHNTYFVLILLLFFNLGCFHADGKYVELRFFYKLGFTLTFRSFNCHFDAQVKAGTPLMQLVAADWFKSDKREDHIAAHDGCVIQKLFAKQVLLILRSKSKRCGPRAFEFFRFVFLNAEVLLVCWKQVFRIIQCGFSMLVVVIF